MSEQTKPGNWHREATRSTELGYLVMEGDEAIALCPTAEKADRIVALEAVVAQLRAFIPEYSRRPGSGDMRLIVTDGVLYEDDYPELFELLTQP